MHRTKSFLWFIAFAIASSSPLAQAQSTSAGAAASGSIDSGNYVPSTANLQTYSQQELSELEVFTRCYRHLTKMYPLRTNPLRVAVAAGTMTASAACGSLITKTTFNSSGTISTDDPESRAVLQNFSTFHNTWFANYDFTVTVPTIENLPGTYYVYDEFEPSLYLTRALFGGVNYSTVVTASTSMSAVRDRVGNVAQPAPSPIVSYLTPDILATVANESDATLSGAVQIGALTGVVPITSVSRANDLITFGNSSLGFQNLTSPFTIAAKTAPYKINTHFGGGVMGSISYYLLNNGRNMAQASEGGLYVPRRWAKMVYHDLLCRDIPVVRITDTALFVNSAPSKLTPPFRTGKSCMQCHGSMDQMAYTARNLVMNETPTGIAPTNGTASVVAVTATKPADVGLVDTDSTFAEQTPSGRLFFRSYDGTLIDQPVTGINGLGAALANTNDLYVCAASRYFEYFTGVHINLQDSGDTTLPALSADDVKYRNLVIDMGMDLKQSQSLSKLVQEIINQPIYRTRSMRYLDQGSN